MPVPTGLLMYEAIVDAETVLSFVFGKTVLFLTQ